MHRNNYGHIITVSTYISALCDDKVSCLVVKVAGEDILVLPGAVPHQVVAILLTLAFC